MKKQKERLNANFVGVGLVSARKEITNSKTIANTAGVAPLGDPHFEEHAKNTPRASLNPNSNISLLISNHRGITLIALIITIIVMLILVAVTVTVAINGGLFKTAKQAKADTQANIDAEQRLASGRIKVDGKWYNSLEDYTNGIESSDQNDEPSKWAQDKDGNITYDGEKSEIKIGDYVNYTYDTVNTAYDLPTTITGYDSPQSINQTIDLNWRVLGVDANGCLTLISDKPTTQEVYFEGAKGHNNGVYILNDICAKQYSNTDLGVIARSITIEDIEAGFKKETGIAKRNEYTNGVKKYGETKTYTTERYLNYPVIYAEENGSGIGVKEEDAETGINTKGIGGSDPFYKTENELTTKKPEGKESKKAGDNQGEQKALTCKQTYYSFSSTPENYCKNREFHEMIFKTNSYYWLASRCYYCGSNYASFGLHSVSNADLGGSGVFASSSVPTSRSNFLRPVVSLGSNALEIVSGSGAEDDPYILD